MPTDPVFGVVLNHNDDRCVALKKSFFNGIGNVVIDGLQLGR